MLFPGPSSGATKDGGGIAGPKPPVTWIRMKLPDAMRQLTAGNDFSIVTPLIEDRIRRNRLGRGEYTFWHVHGACGLFYENPYPVENSSLLVGCPGAVGDRPNI
jgi:hypothetical protein